MSRLSKLFQQIQQQQSPKKVLNIYCTAGYPALNSTLPIMQSLERNGADIIELGMPYSDPLADGAVIQASGSIALANGMTIEVLFEQLKGFRQSVSVPVILMGYMNPVLQYGFEKFCEKAASVGIDGLILPDLPQYEFETIYGSLIKKNGLDFIFLVTPETTAERIKQLDALSSGFLYAVSSSSTTGTDQDMSHVDAYLQRLHNYQLNNPLLVGFGIKDKKSFDAATVYTDGAIIGSAFIKALNQTNDIETTTKQFLDSVLK